MTIKLPSMLHSRLFSFIALATIYCCLDCVGQLNAVQVGDVVGEEGVVMFNRDVRPILTKHCTGCHGGVKQAAGLSFVYPEEASWTAEAGDLEDSVLFERVISDDPDERMPPPEHGPPLSKQEIETLKKWIEQGADWKTHWAFEKPKNADVPKVSDPKWATTSIDPFVLSRLEKENIKPSPDAQPARWLRRVSLDLTGLPPTLQEREDFLSRIAESKTAGQKNSVYADEVDRLLALPAYGERWASVWLDQVRYADSKGLGVDGRRNIWKYRDWVIDALNKDLAYDEFTVKQIAGDLLPDAEMEDLIATAVHRLTQSNEEGGTDDEEFRVAAVLDRVNTTWQAWQGITFGCTQCHAHPYDPIRHEEFYQFAGFFNNTQDSDLNEEWPVVSAPIDSSQYESAAKLDREFESVKTEIWERQFSAVSKDKNWQPLTGLMAKTNNQTKVVVKTVANRDEYRTVDTVTKGTQFTLTAPVPDGLKQLTAIRFTALPLDSEKAATDSEWGFVVSHLEARLILPDNKTPQPIEIGRIVGDEPMPFHDPNGSLNPKSNVGFSAYTRIFAARSAALILKEPLEVPAGAKLQVVLKHRILALGAFPLIARRGHLAVSDSKDFSDLLTDKQLNSLKGKLSKLKANRRKIKSTSVPVLRERPEHLSRPQHVFIRGLFLTKDKQVQPSTPASFAPMPKNLPANRLAMAKWLVSGENPLTSRVAVNRVWARLFGVGLVATEEDFGSSGDLPSHPKLLDHLAVKFQGDFGWKQKELLKELVLSRTYRQSSVVRPELLERDPNNRLLARGPRHRLPAETIRDQALAISGLLQTKMYGKPVHPPIPAGVWTPFSGKDKWETPKRDSEDRYRKSIYTYTKRSIPYPMFAAFDCPSREVNAPRRLRSNTPTHALTTLNDETFVECFEAFAKQIQESAKEPQQQVKLAFTSATCREPTESEVNELVMLLDSYADDKTRGYQTLASVLLNLDEVLTK